MNKARAAEKYKVVCPVCGKQLFSSSSADVEDVMCPKCKKQYVVRVGVGSLQIRESQMQYSADNSK